MGESSSSPEPSLPEITEGEGHGLSRQDVTIRDKRQDEPEVDECLPPLAEPLSQDLGSLIQSLVALTMAEHEEAAKMPEERGANKPLPIWSDPCQTAAKDGTINSTPGCSSPVIKVKTRGIKNSRRPKVMCGQTGSGDSRLPAQAAHHWQMVRWQAAYDAQCQQARIMYASQMAQYQMALQAAHQFNQQ